MSNQTRQSTNLKDSCKIIVLQMHSLCSHTLYKPIGNSNLAATVSALLLL